MTNAPPEVSPEQILDDIASSLPNWIAAGGTDRVLQEWQNLLAGATTQEALMGLRTERRRFAAFFLKLLGTEGIPKPSRYPSSWSFWKIFDARDDQLRSFAQLHSSAGRRYYFLARMAARLLLYVPS